MVRDEYLKKMKKTLIMYTLSNALLIIFRDDVFQTIKLVFNKRSIKAKTSINFNSGCKHDMTNLIILKQYIAVVQKRTNFTILKMIRFSMARHEMSRFVIFY